MSNIHISEKQILSDLKWMVTNLPFELPLEFSSFSIHDCLIPHKIISPIEFKTLGKYYEDLLAIILVYNGYKILLKGQQIFENDITVGEVDFLISKGDRTVHLEVALKYYLQCNDGKKEKWIGPNSKDQLSNKVAKLKKQLSVSVPVQEFGLERNLFVQGILFKHSDGYLEDNCWIHADQNLNTEGFVVYKLNRENWISGFARTKVIEMRNELILVEETKKARQFVLLSKKDNIEYRLMVVPSNWPNI